MPSGASDLLAGLHRACFPEDPWGATAIAQICRIRGFFGAIASDEDRPMGFVLALDLGEACEILSLGVIPAQRRRGVAGALLDSASREARRRGAEALILEVAEDNAPARTLYAANGFLPIGRRPNYYRRADGATAALVLRLTLSPETAT